MRIRQLLFALTLIALSTEMRAQDSTLLKMLDDSMTTHAKKIYTTGTFKATHVINMQTVESSAAGVLTFVIQHRFGQLNSGSYNFFGLDNATLRLGLDYGITDRLDIGIGRSSYLKTFDGFVKYKLFRQTEGGGMPLSVSVLGEITNYTQDVPGKPYLNTKYRTAYAGQFLIARKVSSILSLQLVPSYLHYNLVPTVQDKNDVFTLGMGGRLKITKRMSINAEYNYLPSNQVVTTKCIIPFRWAGISRREVMYSSWYSATRRVCWKHSILQALRVAGAMGAFISDSISPVFST